MTTDLRVRCQVVEDDGSDGYFWREGARWLRSRGKELRVEELAPHLEPRYMHDLCAPAGAAIWPLERECYERTMRDLKQ